MSGTAPTATALLLRRMHDGDARAADELLRVVYDELHRLAERYMRDERAEHTLQPTALVNEAWLRLAGRPSADFDDRRHFVGVAAVAMRNVLVDHARSRLADKRQGGRARLVLEEGMALDDRALADILSVNDVLERLASMDPELARVVDLRFFGGLTTEETASVLGVSTRTVERSWTTARAWLRAALAGEA